MSQQNVYFTDPTQITQLGTKSTYVQQSFNSNATANLTAYINTLKTTGFPALSGMSSIVVNGATNESAFYCTGTRNAAGQPMTADTQMSYYSAAKMALAGPVLAKMLEDRWFTTSDAVSSYIPEWAGMTGVYIDNVTDLQIPGYPYPATSASGGWTGTFSLVEFPLSDIKISHCLSMSIGLPYDFEGVYSWLPCVTFTGTFCAPVGSVNYVTGASRPNVAVSLLNQSDLSITNQLHGIAWGNKMCREIGGLILQMIPSLNLFTLRSKI